jgi:hypothetical protein
MHTAAPRVAAMSSMGLSIFFMGTKNTALEGIGQSQKAVCIIFLNGETMSRR